ncbi:MAG: anthranilate 1,2-dioxygenase, partial [Rhodospirillaceae bacterium]|nr:anthranilate 1,2-dioxygenase [Rhodospirillaceae bacterium]
SVGTYRDLITFADGKPLFKEKIAVADTFGIPRLLSTPI